MATWVEITQIAANCATALGVIGLVVAYRQLRAAQRLQREATAMGIWKDYLQLAMHHPRFSYPEADPITAEGDLKEYIRYEWFVSSMLFACEQILTLTPNDAHWRSVIESQLSYHQRYLASSDFNATHYGSQLQALLRNAVRSPAPS